ncbi:MAG: DUF4190 domain-containing protein [Acidimicrobiales bacterium]
MTTPEWGPPGSRPPSSWSQPGQEVPPPPASGNFPPPPPYYGAQARTNGMAIASMVLGIIWLMWLGSILALIFGYIAKRQIRERGEAGSGMATAGIVLGWIGVGILSLYVLGAIIAFIAR